MSSLGVNTFFTGNDATNIAVNNVLTTDPSMLAAGKGNVAGSNTNAQALSLAGAATVAPLGGKSLTDYYSDYMSSLASSAKNASDDVTSANTIHDTIFSQQQAVSGVSMDEEVFKPDKIPARVRGIARFITVVDEMMQTVLGLIT